MTRSAARRANGNARTIAALMPLRLIFLWTTKSGESFSANAVHGFVRGYADPEMTEELNAPYLAELLNCRLWEAVP